MAKIFNGGIKMEGEKDEAAFQEFRFRKKWPGLIKAKGE